MVLLQNPGLLLTIMIVTGYDLRYSERMRQSNSCQSEITELLSSGVGTIYTAYQAVALANGGEIVNCFGGSVSLEPKSIAITADSIFDIASITKLFTVIAVLRAVEANRIKLDAPVSTYLPEFKGVRQINPYPDPLSPGKFVDLWPEGGTVNINEVTIKHLLCHTSGIGAWYPLFNELVPESPRGAAFQAAISKPFCAPIGKRIIYSDLGLIVLGEVLERMVGRSLEWIVKDLCASIGLKATFNPTHKESCPATEFRKDLNKRMHGEVHDENAYGMGGIAPHAGLFASATELANFGESIRTAKLISPELLASATAKVVGDGNVSRGLGFALATPGDASANGSLSSRAYGHYGFTGTSLWIDPERRLVAVLLTNRVFFGRASNTGITEIRRAFHKILSRL